MLGLIGYKKETLNLIENSKESKIQEIESIEQLWLISNRYDIYGVELASCLPSVNTSNDINRVLNYIKENQAQQNIINKIIRLT